MTATSSSTSRTTLPRPPTSFIGRADEIASLRELLLQAGVRLVTLTGPGGVGKTRLSLEVGHQLASEPGWRVEFISLAAVDRPEQALSTVGERLGIWNAQNEDLIQRMVRVLEGQRTLLVLDNLEQVIDIASDVAALISALPDLTVLATSRTPLHIYGEREYSVPQLTAARADERASVEQLLEHESVALFVERARAVDQQFRIDESNAAVIADIGYRLDGLPLAIELAAARIKSLPPAALLERLDSQLNILRTDARDVPVRLRTIRATIDWSYSLLSREEQETFRMLSIFSSDFSLEAAGAVLGMDEGDTLDRVSSLIDKSLLASRPPFEHRPYFRMLTAVREFGRERLAESGNREIASRRHAEYLARLCERLFPGQFDRDQVSVHNLLDREHRNIRQAVNWAIEAREWVLAARIAAHLWQYWDIRGNLAEGRRWFEHLLEQDVDYPLELVPNLYFGFAILAGSAEEAARSAVMAHRLLEIGERTGDRRILATARSLLGIAQPAGTGLQDSLVSIELWDELGEPVWAGMAAGDVSRYARELGDVDMAESYAYQSYETLRTTGHRWGIALAYSSVGRVLYLRGDASGALAWFQDGLRQVLELGDQILVLRLLEFIRDVAGTQGQYALAVQLSGATARMREQIAYGIRFQSEVEAAKRILADARKTLGDDVFTRLWESGEQQPVREIVNEALVIQVVNRQALESSQHDGFRLTRRERDVLQRIVAGKTDQQIADELYVSYRTVTTHVTNILNELTAGSRTEAAAIAVRDRLI